MPTGTTYSTADALGATHTFTRVPQAGVPIVDLYDDTEMAAGNLSGFKMRLDPYTKKDASGAVRKIRAFRFNWYKKRPNDPIALEINQSIIVPEDMTRDLANVRVFFNSWRNYFNHMSDGSAEVDEFLRGIV